MVSILFHEIRDPSPRNQQTTIPLVFPWPSQKESASFLTSLIVRNSLSHD